MFGYDWKVTRENRGGFFSFKTHTINIPKNTSEPLAYLIHEIMEAVTVHLYLRYEGMEGGQELMFIMDHTRFSSFADMVTQILLDNKLMAG